MNTILNSLSEADKNKSFLTIYKDGADFDIKLLDFSKGSLKLLNGIDLSASLTEVTDNIGTISPLQLSTTQVNVGGGTSLGRLVVRGDGTNSIARFDTSAGGFIFQVLNTGLFWGNGDNGQGGRLQGGGSGLFYIGQDVYNYGSMPNWISFSAGTGILVSGVAGAYMPSDGFFGIIRTFSNDVSQAAFTQNQDYKFNNHRYTINNTRTSTGTATGIFLNATETALNGMSHNLMDLQVGGVSKIRVANNGFIYLNAASSAYINATVGGQLNLVSNSGTGNPINIGSNGEIKVYYNAIELTAPISNATPIKLGGTTSSFPMIKRNGAAIDFRLADDSGYCDVNGKGFQGTYFYIGSTYYESSRIYIGATTNAKLQPFTSGFSIEQGTSVAINASAIFQLNSTTQGFLPPRMTTAQVNAIATPAEGLVVFNTTISHLCVYQAGVWVKLSHSPM
jgi:hypothetical protein